MLELTNISVHAGNFSLKSVGFTVEKGDYFILLGVSGAGKSMVLETIAGLVQPDSGTIRIDGRDITFEKIQHRGIGLVFQDHAVFPHMSVRNNIGYSLHGLHLRGPEKQRKVEEIARQMSISGLLNRHPGNLSGGELQRIALARTLVQEPSILLLDEPLASLDTQIRAELRGLLRKLNRNGQTIIHVTHDYEEALSLGNRIAVIHDGIILQTGTPEEVFRNPGSEFVASFTGVRNFFRADILEKNGVHFAKVRDSVLFRLAGEVQTKTGFIVIRPEDIVLSKEKVDSSATNNFQGKITDLIPSKSGIEVIIDTGVPLHAVITNESSEHLNLAEGKPVWIFFKATAIKFIPG